MQAAKQHILIVDDSEDDAMLLSAELRGILPNTEFQRVENEEEMREALAHTDWDLIISDHTMPKFDSRRALELVKRSHKDIPVIIVSGTMSENLGVGAMAVGARDYIDKSNRARLLPVVKRELRNASLRKAKEDAERNLIQLTFYDPLTRLPNRQLLTKLMNASLLRKQDTGGMAALIFIDLDRFMRVNESFGYATGDQLLQRVAERLHFCLDDFSIIARLGQDKFAVFLENIANHDHAQRFAERITSEFDAPFILNGEEFFMTCAIGVCLYPDDGEDANALIKNAESAKFAAKKLGPRNIRVYVREASPRLGNPLRIENALRHAVERNELFLLFQPILDLASDQVVGGEALLRWRHPQLGVIPPDAFIPIADDTGLIIDIGKWVLLAACRQVKQWQERGLPEMMIAINVSAAQFRKPGFADDVADVLVKTGVDPRLLELEITETVVMHDAETTIGTLRLLKKMGVCISVDDFGTGYSSLSYLKRFPIDSLKIDKSFVRDLDIGSDNQAIVNTIIGLAKSLKLTVIAEGVETAEQLAYLRSQDCDRMQGYLLSKPLEPEAFVAVLHSPNWITP